MLCIFCKKDSSKSTSIEHIIPESLGNKEYVLPSGVICDSCNSYFGLKVEKPLLDSDYFRQARFRNIIFNKDDRVPTIQGILLPGILPIEMALDKDGKGLFSSRERDTVKLINTLKSIRKGELIFPAPEKPDDYLMSRFLAKVGLEILTSRLLEAPDGLNEIINKSELNDLRNYARFGKSHKTWPFNTRIIYPEKKLFTDDNQRYEILHEYNLLYTEAKELYSVIVIFGIEYVINMGEPSLEGYIEWLKKNENKSPLYMNDNSIPMDPKSFTILRPPF